VVTRFDLEIAQKRTDCTKSTRQCRSMNNVLDGSKVVAKKLATAEDLFMFGEDNHLNCSRDQNDKGFVIK